MDHQVQNRCSQDGQTECDQICIRNIGNDGRRLSRIRWAGLEWEDFELVTTYENSRYCKPNPVYYRQTLEILGESSENCIMVGNDVQEDMMARELGMQVIFRRGKV